MSNISYNLPSCKSIEQELLQAKLKVKKQRQLFGTVLLFIVAAAAIVLATSKFPILRIYGHSMSPTLNEKEIVLTVKGDNPKAGEIWAFYVGNKILVKRCIATGGQMVSIDREGIVSVDGSVLFEPYVKEEASGESSISFPYQVPAEKYFFLGDNRAASADSRHSTVGAISDEQLIGKVVWRLWPLDSIGKI